VELLLLVLPGCSEPFMPVLSLQEMPVFFTSHQKEHETSRSSSLHGLGILPVPSSHCRSSSFLRHSDLRDLMSWLSTLGSCLHHGLRDHPSRVLIRNFLSPRTLPVIHISGSRAGGVYRPARSRSAEAGPPRAVCGSSPRMDGLGRASSAVKGLAYHLSSTLGRARTSAGSAPYKSTNSAIPLAPTRRY
jgi:hypothetical protein